MRRLRSIDSALIAGLVAVSSAIVIAYVLNSPRLDRFPDTLAYETVANHLPGSFISSERLPGYPLVMALSSLLPGGRDVELLILQSLMVVSAVVLIYFIGRAALGNSWLAFVPAFLVASDLLLAGFARVAMSETQAVVLTTAVAAAAVAYLRTVQTRYMWLTAGLMIALAITRPEWAYLAIVLVPYALVVIARRGLLDRKRLTEGVVATAAVLFFLGAYSLGNLVVNGYFGMSSIVNVALLGKVMVYQMEDEAPPPYDALAPQVKAIGPALGPWPLMSIPPFNDRNHKLAGEFGRAVILHDPVGFSRRVYGTLLGSSTEYDAVYLRIHDSAPFAAALNTLLGIGEQRYSAFILVLPLAVAWLVAGLIAPPGDHRTQMLGALSVIVLYGALSAASGTFDEFGRIHMPINPISTLLVFGTVLLNVAYAFTHRNVHALVPLGVAALEVVAILWLPGHSERVMSGGLAAIALLQLIVSGTWRIQVAEVAPARAT